MLLYKCGSATVNSMHLIFQIEVGMCISTDFPQHRPTYQKNVLQLLYIIAHEITIYNSVSEYTHGPWKVSDACSLQMSCISEQESAKNVSGFIIGMNGNSLF